MDKALAMLEFNTVSGGIRALDIITKASAVDVLSAQPVCPGKFMILLAGALAAVNESVQAACTREAEHEIDHMILGNPAEPLLSALYATTEVPAEGALGVIETYSGASTLLAADTAAKAARIVLVEVRLSRGMCGKSYVLMAGPIADIETAVAAARTRIAGDGMLLDTAVIANPDAQTRAAFL